MVPNHVDLLVKNLETFLIDCSYQHHKHGYTTNFHVQLPQEVAQEIKQYYSYLVVEEYIDKMVLELLCGIKVVVDYAL